MPPRIDALDRWLPSPVLKASAALHLAAAALVAASPGRWRPALTAVIADQLLLLAASVTPRSALLGPNLTRLPAAAASRGEVALTFDDGPHPDLTPRVLDLLDRAGARASFFVIGQRAAAHPDLAREIAGRGHRLENHTWSHPHTFALRGRGGLAREITPAQDLIAELAGRAPAFFRPPAGMRNPLLAGVLGELGLALATWTRRGFDTVSRQPARVTHRLLRGLAAGDVLLLHDGGTVRDRPTRAGSRLVLEVLPTVLAALEARSLRAVALPDPAPRGRMAA